MKTKFNLLIILSLAVKVFLPVIQNDIYKEIRNNFCDYKIS